MEPSHTWEELGQHSQEIWAIYIKGKPGPICIYTKGLVYIYKEFGGCIVGLQGGRVPLCIGCDVRQVYNMDLAPSRPVFLETF